MSYHIYSKGEYDDMVTCYRDANYNANAARLLYAERHPHRKQLPTPPTIIRAMQRLRDWGTHHPVHFDRGRPRLHFHEEETVPQHFNRSGRPTQNICVVVAETAIAPEDNDPVLCGGVKKEDVTEQCEDPLLINSRCDDCQIIFISKDNFKAHRRNIHGHYRCSECQVGFKNKHRLHIHINSVHSYDIIYICDYCQKKFTNKEYIQIHMNIAHSRGSFKYDACEHDQQSMCSKFGETSGEGRLPPEVNAVASASSEHQYEVFIKEEPELELGPVVLQHMDCNYRPYKEEPLLD